MLVCPRRDERNTYCLNRYIKFFKEMNWELIMPLFCDTCNIESLLDECDGLLLLGGGDIDPVFYHQKNIEKIIFDHQLDQYEFDLIDYFVAKKRPIICICRGIQTINVYFGGTLKQDIPNHDNSVHTVSIYDDRLEFLEDYMINSFHHQSIKKIAPNFEILALSGDQEIEAIKHKFLPIYGYQFHPELFENKLRRQFENYLKSLIE